MDCADTGERRVRIARVAMNLGRDICSYEGCKRRQDMKMSIW